MGGSSTAGQRNLRATAADGRRGARTRDPLAASNTTLRATAEAFGSLYGTSSLVALVLDRRANIVYANAALLDATGWCADEVLGTSWFERFLEQPCDRLLDAFERLLANDPAITVYVNDVLTRSRRTRTVRWQNALVRDDGHIVGTASVGEFIDGAAGPPDSRIARSGSAYEVVALARALVDDPEAGALPFVQLVAEQCAQLAEEGGPGDSALHAAERIRRMFRTTPG